MLLALSQKGGKQQSKHFSIYLAAAIFTIFLISHPGYFLIIDEVFYYQQGIAYFSEKQHLLENILYKEGIPREYHSYPGKYPLGIPLLVALFSKVLGAKGIFLIGGISLAASMYLLGETMEKANISPKWTSLTLFFLPALVLSRSIMSGMPSMLITSLFLYLLLKEKNIRMEILLAGFLAGISILFRETNIIVLGILSIPFLIKNRYSLLFILGGILGSTIRPILTYSLYNDIFHNKASSGFSFVNLGPNLLLYAIAFLVFVPLGWLALIRYQGKYHKAIKASVGTYTLLFLFYNYNGIQESGLKSLVLAPRFLLPALPMMIWVTAHYFEQKLGKYKNKVANACVALSLIAYITYSFLARTFDSQRQEFLQFLSSNSNAVYILTDYRDEPKYFNAFTAPRKHVENKEKEIQAVLDKGETIYWVDLKRQGILGKNNNFASSHKELQGDFKKTSAFRKELMDGQFIQVYQINPNSY